MIIQKNIILFILLIFISGCSGISKEHIIGKYFLVTADELVDTALCFELSSELYLKVVTGTVFSVGFNSEYILVKSHPRTWPNNPNKDITNYFIVEVQQDKSSIPDEHVFGPFNEREFNDRKVELGIDTLNFSYVIEELE